MAILLRQLALSGGGVWRISPGHKGNSKLQKQFDQEGQGFTLRFPTRVAILTSQYYSGGSDYWEANQRCYYFKLADGSCDRNQHPHLNIAVCRVVIGAITNIIGSAGFRCGMVVDNAIILPI